MDSLQTQVVQSGKRRPDKVYDVNIISNGDPLEIFTDKEGGVIFKKYSLMGGLTDFAAQMCETLSKTTGRIAVITDRDTCVAAAGLPKRELTDKRVSSALENIMEGRQIYQHHPGADQLPVAADNEKYIVATAAPILSEGDVMGCVLFAGTQDDLSATEVDYKLVQTVSGFLGRHMES